MSLVKDLIRRDGSDNDKPDIRLIRMGKPVRSCAPSDRHGQILRRLKQQARTDPGCAASGRRGQPLSAAVLQAQQVRTDPVRGCAKQQVRQTLSPALLQATGADRLCPRLWFRRLARTDSVRGSSPSDMRGQTLEAKARGQTLSAALLQAVLQASGADRPCPRLCSATGADRRGSAPRDMRGQTLSAAVLHERQVRTDPVRGCSLSDRRGQTLSAAVLQPRGLSAAVP
jgi:hypothetical protein